METNMENEMGSGGMQGIIWAPKSVNVACTGIFGSQGIEIRV